MRRKHGLESDRFTILVSAGGFGVGPVGHLIQALAKGPGEIHLLDRTSSNRYGCQERIACASAGAGAAARTERAEPT